MPKRTEHDALSEPIAYPQDGAEIVPRLGSDARLVLEGDLRLIRDAVVVIEKEVGVGPHVYGPNFYPGQATRVMAPAFATAPTRRAPFSVAATAPLRRYGKSHASYGPNPMFTP
jgi:hypothetical protein